LGRGDFGGSVEKGKQKFYFRPQQHSPLISTAIGITNFFLNLIQLVFKDFQKEFYKGGNNSTIYQVLQIKIIENRNLKMSIPIHVYLLR
jgi:hypothetical protein